MAITAKDITFKCNELKTFWEPRNEKFKDWYKTLRMVDRLAADKMESFVGNDPRAIYNLVLHLLDKDIPHRIDVDNFPDPEQLEGVEDVNRFLDTAWTDIIRAFRRTGPFPSLNRHFIGLMLATGWYARISFVSDSGLSCVDEVWNPAEVFPMWTDGLTECAHIKLLSKKAATAMAKRNGWSTFSANPGKNTLFDYWMVDDVGTVWNYIVLNTTLVKSEATRFHRIPIYISPIGGLPDTGVLADETISTSGTTTRMDSWKADIGQSILATNDNVYKYWNKWWTFALQLMRDTAQPKIIEKSRTGKPIVRTEDITKRGATFRMTPEDSVDYLMPPPMPLELRSTQLDLEAMMQRGGVSFAMYGNLQGQVSAYVMSQISESANQIVKPFLDALVNCYSDIDNDWLEDIRLRQVTPYGFKYPPSLPPDALVTAKFEPEVPGELVQKATVARMLDPEFRMPLNYVVRRLFPDIKSLAKFKAEVRADQAERNPMNALIAQIQYYQMQAEELNRKGNPDAAKLYELAAQASMAMLAPPQAPPAQTGGAPGTSPDMVPPSITTTPTEPVEA